MLRYGLLLLVLTGLVILPSPSHAADSLSAVSRAEISNDPGFEGLWKYTLDVYWNVERFDAGHFTFLLDMAVFADTCSESSLQFPTGAGMSTGIDSTGAFCDVLYTGLVQCKTDPSLNAGDLGLSIKYTPMDEMCWTTTSGEGTFVFYSTVAPGLPGLHADGIVLKHGQDVDYGDLNGVIPRLNGFVEPTTFDVKISQFLVVPPAGVKEFVGIRNAGQETVSVDGWTAVIDDEFVVEYEDSLPPGGSATDTTFMPNERVLIDFDFDPQGQPIPAGTNVANTYSSLGVIFSAEAAQSTCDSTYANGNWFDFSGFGSSPNVISMCPNLFAADISDEFFGRLRATFPQTASEVCIDVYSVGPGERGFLRAIGFEGEVVDEVVTPFGFVGQICVSAEFITAVVFSGADTSYAVFDDLEVVLNPIVIPAPGGIGPDAGQQTTENFVPDKGGTIVLKDASGVVQDSVGYGNQGGAPISAPLIVPAGSTPPAAVAHLFRDRLASDGVFQATEDETLATSTQRIGGSQDTGNDANDFNVGVLESDDSGTNVNNAEPPALGSSIRLNKVYAFSLGDDGVELFNPLDQEIDVSGWHISDGSIIAPFATAARQVIPFGGVYELRQGQADAFEFELEFDDVLYLYDDNLVRLDQIGWSQFPTFFPDSCLQRTPDGVGPADGFDFATSGGSIGLLVYDTCDLQGPVVVSVSPGPGLVTRLANPYPNPSRSASTLEFVLGGGPAARVDATIRIYDVSGRLVRELLHGELEPGVYRAVWDGLRNDGSRAGAGVYFARLSVDRRPVGGSRPIVWLAP